MGRLTFSDDPSETFEVPRLDDDQIDDLFYQEDEIGEMRHSAFMIECGLEEDPPDGPDVPPIPWQLTDTDAARGDFTTALEAPRQSPSAAPERVPPKRTASLDDIEDLEKERAPRQKEPRRRLVAAKSGTLHNMRRMPEKTQSADSIVDAAVGLPLARDDKSPRRRPQKLVAAKSGSLHGMRDAAKKAKDNDTSSPSRSPRRKLVATKSGTLHGMRQAAQKAKEGDSPMARKLSKAKSGTFRGLPKKPDLETKDSSPVVPRRRPVTLNSPEGSMKGSLIKGSSHQLINKRRATREKAEKKLDCSSDTEDEDEEEFQSDGFGRTDVESDASVDTDDDEPKKSPKRSAGKEKTKKGMKEKKKKDSAEADEDEKEAKSKQRVFRNGKEVKENTIQSRHTALENDESTGKQGGTKVNAAVTRFRHGNASPADLLKSMQISRPPSMPKKSVSVAHVNDPSELQRKSSARTRPAKIKMPKKAKSVNDANIPPAFRSTSTK